MKIYKIVSYFGTQKNIVELEDKKKALSKAKEIAKEGKCTIVSIVTSLYGKDIEEVFMTMPYRE